MNPDELLAHAGFVHSLARSLVRDEHHAADVEQRTWLAALEHPPTSDKNIRSWFSRVVKNFVITMYRGETRRMKYENALEQPENLTSPEEISIRKEVLKKMSEAVFNLEEPYFSTVLLRYYEDLPAAMVAERLGIPLETVKTRLQRALKILKKNLDKTHHGNRKEWCLALAAVAGVNVAAASSVSAAITASGTSLTPAAATVSVHLKLCLLATLFVGASLTLFQFFADSTSDSNAPDPLSATSLADESGTKVISKMETSGEETSAPESQREALASQQILLAGTVTNQETGDPITAFDIKVKRFIDMTKGDMPVHETVHTDDGTFSVAVPEAGTYDIEIKSSRFDGARITELEIPEKTGVQDLQVQLNPGKSLSGRVVDDATDDPVAGALVGPCDYYQETDLVSIGLLGYSEDGIHTYTDEAGEFLLEGLFHDNKIAVVHPDYAEGYVNIDENNPTDVEIRLKKGYRIYGKAFDDDGNPAEGVLIHLLGTDIPTLRSTTSGPDGGFRTAPTLPGRVVIKAGEPDWEYKGNPNFTDEYKIVEVVDQDVEIRLGPSPDLVTLSGTLYDFDGTPRSGGEFSLSSGNHSPWTARWHRLVRIVKCDENGRFHVDKLAVGRHRVIFFPPGQSPFEWGMLAFDTPGEVEMNIHLNDNASCSGTVIHALTGAPCTDAEGEVWAMRSAGYRPPYQAKLDKNGAFEIRGLAPGCYTLSGKVNGMHTKRLMGVNIGKGDRLTDLRLELPPSGTLQLQLDGFEEFGRNHFDLYLSGGQSDRNLHFHHRLDSSGNYEKTMSLQTGRWTLAVSFAELGFLQREFEIFDNQEESFVIHRDDLYIRPSTLSVKGSVTYTDGSPVQNLSVVFQAASVPGLEESNKELRTRLARDGSYALKGLKPGRWKIKGQVNDNAWVEFPPIWIAPDATDPFVCPLTLAHGCVTGSLFNGLEHRPITYDSDATWKWKAYLYNVAEDRNTGGFETANVDGNIFFLYGAPAGKYQLVIRAEGYEDYESDTFSLEEGEVLDLDRIMLNPCGVLNVEVVDEFLQPIRHYRLSCEGLHRYYSHSTEEGIKRYDNLPVGLVTVIIEAKGYKTQRVKVQLEPAGPVDTRVILTRETK